jgi:hypothetical protein
MAVTDNAFLMGAIGESVLRVNLKKNFVIMEKLELKRTKPGLSFQHLMWPFVRQVRLRLSNLGYKNHGIFKG